MVADCAVAVVKKHHLPAHISQEAFGFSHSQAVCLGMCSGTKSMRFNSKLHINQEKCLNLPYPAGHTQATVASFFFICLEKPDTKLDF